SSRRPGQASVRCAGRFRRPGQASVRCAGRFRRPGQASVRCAGSFRKRKGGLMADLPLLIVVAILALYLFSSINILAEYERGVIFRLGRLLPLAKGPGLI